MVAECNDSTLIAVGRDSASTFNYKEITEAEWMKNFSKTDPTFEEMLKR